MSKDEAARMPALAEKFAQHGRDGDGFLSKSKFLAGYRPTASPATTPAPKP